MSRTTRKPKWYREHTEVSFINNDWCVQRSTSISVRKRRDKKIVAKELEAAQTKFEAELAANGGSRIKGYYKSSWSDTEYPIYIRPDVVHRFTYTRVEVSKDYFRDKARQEYKTITRDGKYTESRRKKNFRNDCARTNRRNNKEFCRKVMNDEWEDTSAPRYTDTNFKRWAWW